MAIGTGEQAPEFDLEEAFGKPRLRLADFRGKRNVLLVFHPFAFTEVCREEALDLQANLESFHNAETDVIFVSCDAWAARQAWKEELGVTYAFASDFWQHGAAATATRSARGSALPMSSEARITIRRAMKRASSPPSSIAAR